MKAELQIVADENIPGLEASFGDFGKIRLCNGRTLRNKDVQDADILLVRSVTRVDQGLLANSPVRFLGSATIGVDHLDTSFLQATGIHWCHAPGCNADAAAQYTLAMIVLAAQRAEIPLTGLKAGIIGFGNVGSRLSRLLQELGIREVLACDPPKLEAGQKGLVGMEAIAECNLISFHVPLAATGPYPTRNLGNDKFFSGLQPGTLVVNSSRGGVLDGAALQHWLAEGRGYAALDVWPEEPRIDARLLEKVIVATPHVAGYSLDGKLNGTRMLFSNFLDWQGIKPRALLPPLSPAREILRIPAGSDAESAILAACPVERDDHALRACCSGRDGEIAQEFDQLRKSYPVRRDFAGISAMTDGPGSLAERLRRIGFQMGSG